MKLHNAAWAAQDAPGQVVIANFEEGYHYVSPASARELAASIVRAAEAAERAINQPDTVIEDVFGDLLGPSEHEVGKGSEEI